LDINQNDDNVKNKKTNIEEQKKLIENNNNQIYFDKNINDHLKMFGS